MKNKGMQLGAMLAAMLVMLATIAVPVVATGTNAGATSATPTTTTSCGCSGGCSSNGTAVQVNGSEAHEAIAQALRNTTVKSLMRELIERRYTPETNNAVYYKLSPANETTIVAIPFKKHDDYQDVESHDDGSQNNGSKDEAVIIYRKTSESVIVRALIKNDKVTTLLQDDTVNTYGPGYALVKPIQILMANETYQSLKANLSAQGFKMNESNASVVVNETSNIARISIIAPGQNSSKITYATVDLNKKIVTSINDPDIYTCLGCCGGCIIAIVTQCPFCDILCASCIGLVGCAPCIGCALGCGMIMVGTCGCCACSCLDLC